MFCNECGTQLKPNQKFCTNCGSPAEASALPSAGSKPLSPPSVSSGWQPASKSSSAPAAATARAELPASFATAEVSRPVPVAPVAARVAQGVEEFGKPAARKATNLLLLWGGIGAVALVGVVAAILFWHSPAQQPSAPDTEIEKSIQAKFVADPDLSKCKVEVKSRSGVVTLTGLVNNSSDRSTASRMVLQQPGARTVVDNLVLAAPTSSTGPGVPSPPSVTSSALGNTVTVPGNQAWTATGVFLNVGAVVQISASGGVSFSRGSKPGPPAGDSPDCLTVANGPYGWRAAPYVANQLPCSSLLARIGENGVVFYVGAGTTLIAATPGQLYLGVNDNNFSDNSGFWTASIAVKRNSSSTAGAQEAWLGFANGNVAQDRDAELRRNCGDFKRVYVPDNAGNKFTDLCGSVGKICERVCDWRGTSLSCDAVSHGGNRDGTRVAFCR